MFKADLDQLQTDLAAAAGGRVDLSLVRAHVSAAHADLTALRSIGAPLWPLAPHLGWLPGVGNDVQAAPHLAEAALDFLAAGQIALEAVGPLWPPRVAAGQSTLAAVAEQLVTLPPQLAEAREAVERASGQLEAIDVSALSPALRGPVERVSSALPLLRSGFDLIAVAPGLLGFDRPKTYLVLMQNDDELRPTGGFISSVARVTLDRGEIVELDVRDSYQIDDYLHKPYDLPPGPLLEFMGAELWLFRDANWSPDFPTSARKAAELYTYGLGGSVDGVIGLNQKTVRAIVGALGPIEVEPGQPPVDASNLIAYMRTAWSPPPDATDTLAWIVSRKDFIRRLMDALLVRVQSAPDKINWAGLGRAVFDVFESRDLLVWLDDPAASAIFAEQNWDGAVKPAVNDYWMLVDANVGFNKVNAIVESSVAYTVTLLPDGSADVTWSVAYRHTGERAEGCVHQAEGSGYTLEFTYEKLIQSCYWDYVRLLTPPGAELRQASRQPVPADYLVVARPFDGETRVQTEDGKTVFSTLFVLERGRSTDVTLAYHLPAVVDWTADGGRYTLTVQKQSGAAPHPIAVTLIWPDGYALSQTNLPPAGVGARSTSFTFDLSADRVLSVAWVHE